jgi:hypothetical protein
MKILFLHGLESSPGGTKAKSLEEAGHQVFNPQLPKYSLEESIAIAQGIVDREWPDIIVGSSRGGAIATAINSKGARLVLIAPAWKLYGITPTIDSNTIVLHCKADKIVPFYHTEELAEKSGAKIVECGDCHRMSDPKAIQALLTSVHL